MKILISGILAIFILAGCNSEKKESAAIDTIPHDHHEHDSHEMGNPALAEVMAIHDSIMPPLMNLKQKIAVDIKITDSLLTAKPGAALKKRKEGAVVLQVQLEKADREMMDWMHKFKADTLEKLDREAAAAYIADQKQKIETVRDQMNKSIREAQLFLQK